MTRPIKPLVIKTPQGGMYIISPPGKKPRSLSELGPELAQKMIRQHNGRDALRIFGPYHWGEELVRRYRDECKKSGRRYRREDAINDAADRVRLDRDRLTNWMNRSKHRSKRHDR
jgi:hypothetical protein